MTEALLKEWLENPVSEYFFKYLEDSIKEESEIVKETIMNGGIISEQEQIQKATICATLQRMIDITFEEIDEFYKTED